MEAKRDPRGQGDFGEMSAMAWLAWQGAAVFMPVGNCRDYDLIADFGHGPPLRVQVKTSACFRNDRWVVAVCTRGGNRSWSGVVKKLDASRYDHLFVHVGDGRRWFMPSASVDAGCGLSLGGPKYSEFEVTSGEPLPVFSERLATVPSGLLEKIGRSADVGKSAALGLPVQRAAFRPAPSRRSVEVPLERQQEVAPLERHQ
jgi:hypothetical protein